MLRNTTKINPINLMYLIMGHQMRLRNKSLPTLTLVRFLSTVTPQMYGKRGFLCETLPTHLTPKRFLPRMRSFMHRQILLRRKRFMTKLTDEILLTRMHFHVRFKHFSTTEFLTADSANVAEELLVRFHMRPQIAQRQIGFAANFANVRTFFTIR